MQRLLILLLVCSGPFFSRAQDSLNMTALSVWDDNSLPSLGSLSYNDIWGYTAPDGREYAILGNVGTTVFFDITSPEAIVEVGRFPGQLNSIWRDYKTYGAYAYMCADQGSEGLTIFDLSQLPDTVIQVSQSTEFFTRAHNIFIDEANGRLYVAGGNNPSNGVTILDLTQNPAAPTLLGNPVLPAGGYIHDIFVRDNIAFCSHGTSGFSIYDLSDPTTPVTLGTLSNYPEQGYNHSSWLHGDGDYLVFADETFGRSLKMVDVSDPLEMEVVDLFKSELLAPQATGSIAHNPFIRGDYAIISYYHEGVQVFDISDPLNVTSFAYYDTHPQNTNYQGYDGCWGVYPFFPSGTIIASDTENGLYVLQPEGWSFESEPVFSASLSQSGSVQLCEEETLTLSATIAGQGWVWENSGTPLPDAPTESLTIQEPGQYYLVNNTGTFPAYSDTLTVSITELPAFTGLEATYTFCPGVPMEIAFDAEPDFDSVLLLQQPGSVLIENTDMESFLLPAPGNYSFLGILNDCTTESAVLEATRLPAAPAPEFQPFIPPLCEGDSLVISVEQSPGYVYTITDLGLSFTDTSLLFVPADVYEITTSNGQCDTAFVLGEIPAPLPVPGITQVEDSLFCDLTSSGLFIWLYEGVPVDTTTVPYFLPNEEGTYQVGAQNEAFCWGYSEPIEVMLSSTEDAQLQQLRIFPNPAYGELFLESPVRIEGIQVFNAQGQRVLQSSVYTGPLPTGQWAAGPYFISIKREGLPWVHLKFIKR
ncbi:choice-of-anchor B family protein [Phaeodactylibacter xiamenensis]|uniref:choice-of-anchor B family protein n=1 Tax=Phaeodactylibacter xiamenensis TaxID=1524460 RepID=UPI003BAA574F